MAKVYLSQSFTADGQRRVKLFTDTETDKLYFEDDNGEIVELISETQGVTDDVVIGDLTLKFVKGLLVEVEDNSEG
jgi:hypothetical protein